MSVEEVLKWIETASGEDLARIADELIERDFAASVDDEGLSDGALEWQDEPDIDTSLLDDAKARLRRGEYREALHVLTNALGHDFDALETLPLAST